jgi:diketogulonate reductase-like aldo/keto reductase
MPRVGLGTFRVHGDAATAAVITALQCGYRHIDTASMYKNHRAIQEGVRTSGVPREEIFITSKISPQEMGTEKTKVAFEKCLEELGAQFF